MKFGYPKVGHRCIPRINPPYLRSLPHDNPDPFRYATGVSALRRNLNLRRWPAAWLVAFALAVRLLVPAGYMPMAGAAGLEICAGQTAGMAPMHGMHHDKGAPGDHDRDCGFAAAIGWAADLPVLILPAVVAPVALPVAFLRHMLARPGLGLAAPPPPKTGPPSALR